MGAHEAANRRAQHKVTAPVRQPLSPVVTQQSPCCFEPVPRARKTDTEEVRASSERHVGPPTATAVTAAERLERCSLRRSEGGIPEVVHDPPHLERALVARPRHNFSSAQTFRPDDGSSATSASTSAVAAHAHQMRAKHATQDLVHRPTTEAFERCRAAVAHYLVAEQWWLESEHVAQGDALLRGHHRIAGAYNLLVWSIPFSDDRRRAASRLDGLLALQMLVSGQAQKPAVCRDCRVP